MFDARGFNDSNTCWLYRLIFIVRNYLAVCPTWYRDVDIQISHEYQAPPLASLDWLVVNTTMFESLVF